MTGGMTGGSGPERGREAVRRLREAIAVRESAGEALPMNGRALHLAKICQLLGVGRSTVTQNPAFRAVLQEYANGKGVAFSAKGSPSSGHGPQSTTSAEAPPEAGDGEAMVPASRLREEQRRSAAAERRIGELVARNAALIVRLKRYEATDQALIAAGRRYRPRLPQQENPDPRQDPLELAEPPE